MAFANDIGLIFRIKGDSSDVIRAYKEAEQAGDKLAASNSSLGSSFTSLINPTSLATGALTAIGSIAVVATTAAIALTRTLFDLSKSTAEYGSEIFDASEKTGLHAETLSAMKLAADQSGTSLENVTGGLSKFAKTIGEAANGSEKAQAKLDRLGVTSHDLDTALAQALKTIVNMKPGTDQMTAAMDAFGKSGTELLPFIKSFDGDLEGLVKRAKELGVTIDDTQAKMSDEFSDTLDTIGAQFDGIARTIGFTFMPVFLDMARALSGFIASNQPAIEEWSNTWKRQIVGLQSTLGAFSDNLEEFKQRTGKSWGDIAQDMLDKTGPMIYRVEQLQKLIGGVAKGAAGFRSGEAKEGGGIAFTGDESPRIPSSGKSAKSKGESEAERRAKRDAAAELQIETNLLSQYQQELRDEVGKTIEEFEKYHDVAKFLESVNKEVSRVTGNILIQEQTVRKLEDKKRADNTDAENRLLTQKQETRLAELKKQVLADQKPIQDSLDKNQKRINAETEEAIKRQIALVGQRIEQEEEKLRLQQEMFDVGDRSILTLPGLSEKELDKAFGEESIFEKWTGSFKVFYDTVMSLGPTLGETLNGIANIATNAFEAFADALGSVVQQWVLTGNTGPAVMKKILAATLATIAAEAAVRAIYETAMGFAALFLNPAEAAAHFTAAALFGSIAVGAALAGRAIAPKQDAAGSFASATARGGSEAQNAQNNPLVFTERFNGFQQQQLADRMTQLDERINTTQGFFAEALDRFTAKFGAVTPGHVIMAGAEDASEAIKDAYNSEMGNDLRASTDLYRLQGAYR